MKHIATLICFFFLTNLMAQSSVSIDFEGDKKMDEAKIIATDEGYKISYTLSSQGNKTFSSNLVTLAGQENTLSVKNNVLTINSQFMRGENYFKFRYDAKLKQVKLIGFDNVQYGNAVHDGSGSSSYNLSTGVYEANWNNYDEKKDDIIPLPKVSKKLPIKTYLLNNFGDKVIDELYDLESKLYPK